MSDDTKTIREICGEMAWEHFNQNADPPAVLWRVDMLRRFVGREIRQSNWFSTKQAAEDYARVHLERGSDLMSIVEYSAELSRLRADVERKDEAIRAALASDLIGSGPLDSDSYWRCKQEIDELKAKLTAALADSADTTQGGW